MSYTVEGTVSIDPGHLPYPRPIFIVTPATNKEVGRLLNLAEELKHLDGKKVRIIVEVKQS